MKKDCDAVAVLMMKFFAASPRNRVSYRQAFVGPVAKLVRVGRISGFVVPVHADPLREC